MRNNKFIAGALMLLLVAGCSDEIEMRQELPVSGDEVAFGAVTEDFSEPESRTIYGLPEGEEGKFGSYSKLTISWLYDGSDQVRVYSPQASSECQWADYTVQKTNDAESKAYLAKNEDKGVRWGDTGQNHTFYSFYPLKRISGDGLKGNAMVEASIPTAQERGELLTSATHPDVITDDTWKIIAPDMSYCMMAGKGTWTAGTDKNVELLFTPLVTVLDVVVNGPDENESVSSFNIVSISVRSETEDIVGKFKYNIESRAFDFSEQSEGDNRIATVSCVQGEGSSSLPTTLGRGEKLNVKFFLLPKENLRAEDLSVSVFMEGGYVRTQHLSVTGTTGDGILASGKITRIITPKLSMPETNNWMSLIGDDVLFSQLSLPGTKQSYTGSMDVSSFDPTSSIIRKYQDLYVATGSGTTQFDAGIRAFDVDIESDRSGKTEVYSGTSVVNNPITGRTMTLDDVLNALKGKVQPENEEATEGVVLFLTFVNNNVDSKVWSQNVIRALEEWNQNPENSDVLRQLTTSTTMEQMRGKIAVVMNLSSGDEIPNSPINYIQGMGAGRQSREIRPLNYNGNATVYVQNLMQVNNPTITSDPGTFGWRQGVGLVPYYITEDVATGVSQSLDLIETKKDLMNQMIEQIRNDGGQSLFINDLSGFCVVEDAASTGSSGYRVQRYSSGWFGGWNVTTREQRIYDYQDLPSSGRYDFFQETTPSDPSDNATWLQFPYNTDRDKGNGGNPGAFAELFHEEATNAISALVENGRVPMGIVLMNFAGSDVVQFGNVTYKVQGIRLPGLVMSNNFLFELKTANN